jgi:hypothetical protein
MEIKKSNQFKFILAETSECKSSNQLWDMLLYIIPFVKDRALQILISMFKQMSFKLKENVQLQHSYGELMVLTNTTKWITFSIHLDNRQVISTYPVFSILVSERSGLSPNLPLLLHLLELLLLYYISQTSRHAAPSTETSFFILVHLLYLVNTSSFFKSTQSHLILSEGSFLCASYIPKYAPSSALYTTIQSSVLPLHLSAPRG